MAENTQPTNSEKTEDEAVLDLQNLQTPEADAEVEAHTSTYSVAFCQTNSPVAD